MLRRGLAAAAAAGALLSGVVRAEAAGAWLSSAALTPTEQRVAIAVGPARTTLWTSLRFDAAAGSVAIIVPAPPGSSIDFASDAWFEALEVATAPRLFPPPSVDPFCPGKSGSPNIFQTDGQIGHSASLPTEDVAVLADADAVTAWATQAGFTVSSATQAALAKQTGVQFVALRFAVTAGAGLTPTLRVAMPSAPAMLPLALTQAASEDLRVTAWLIGAGRADLIGATEVAVAPASIAWKAKDGDTDYDDQRASALASDPTRFLVESANHGALGQTTSIADGTASIDSVVSTFFERAAAYGDGDFNASLCVAFADNALVTSSPVAASCPRAAVGVIPPAVACTESPGAGEIDPSKLRCGPGADDLAVALSGWKPTDAWVTRQSLIIAAGGQGADWFVTFAGGATASPVIVTGSVDPAGCADAGAPDGGLSGSGPSGSGSSGSGHLTTSGNGAGPTSTGTGSSGNGNGGSNGGGGVAAADAACSCAGAGTEAAADSCSSDTSSSSGCSSGSSSDSCSGSSENTESCSSNSSSESCSGSSGGDSCSGSSGGDSCSGTDFGKCSTTGARRVRAPKFSILALAGFALLAPLRRRGRKSRGGARARR